MKNEHEKYNDMIKNIIFERYKEECYQQGYFPDMHQAEVYMTRAHHKIGSIITEAKNAADARTAEKIVHVWAKDIAREIIVFNHH